MKLTTSIGAAAACVLLLAAGPHAQDAQPDGPANTPSTSAVRPRPPARSDVLPKVAVRSAGDQPAPTATATTPATATEAADASAASQVVVRRTRKVFRFDQPYTIRADEETSDVVIIDGDLTIDGHVRGDVVLVVGDLQLSPTAQIDGDVVAIGGRAHVAAGASVRGDLVIVGGALDAAQRFSPGGEQLAIGPASIGDALRAFLPWVTRGLLWGRVIVPTLGWIWWIVAGFLVIYVVLGAVAPRAVRASSDTLRARPLAAFAVGLLTILLTGPVFAILVASVVGILVVPFLQLGVLVAWMVGKAGLMRTIGAGILQEDADAAPFAIVRSILIGFTLVTLLYMVPILGLACWGLVGIMGLGSAALALVTTMQRDRAARAPARPPAAPPSEAFAPAPVETSGFAAPPVGGPAAGLRVDESAAMAAAAIPAAAIPGADATSFPHGSPLLAPVSADFLRMPRASFLDRLFAAALDLLVVAIAARLLPWPRPGFWILLLGYHAAFWSWKSTTIGSIICNLRIIRTDGRPLEPVDAVVRALTSLLSGAALGIGFFVIALDSNRERQAWHDKIAGTLVVKIK